MKKVVPLGPIESFCNQKNSSLIQKQNFMYKRGKIGLNGMFPWTKGMLLDQQKVSMAKRGVTGIHTQVLWTKEMLLQLLA